MVTFDVRVVETETFDLDGQEQFGIQYIFDQPGITEGVAHHVNSLGLVDQDIRVCQVVGRITGPVGTKLSLASRPLDGPEPVLDVPGVRGSLAAYEAVEHAKAGRYGLSWVSLF